MSENKSKEITLNEISEKAYLNEADAVQNLLKKSVFFQEKSKEIFNRAEKFVSQIREHNDDLSIENFLKEYSLDTYEGVAIMCLAEALLRIPDSKTADDLIRDKLESGKWQEHLSDNGVSLMNASTFGLMISGKVLNLENQQNPVAHAFGKIVSRIGEPIIREALKKGVEILGGKFVIGTDVKSALKKSDKIGEKGYLFSFDILGEGARTQAQADQYFQAYLSGIKEIGEHYKNLKAEYIYHRPNVSVKLSAIHPRYEMIKHKRVFAELYPRLLEIIRLAKSYDIWVAVDAEEARRFDLNLMIFEKLLSEPEFAGWNGIGYVLQAYQKRAYSTIGFLKNIAEKNSRKIPIRLVKGAYWDSEIKHAQEQGLKDYPVFTNKAHTDLSYLVCARKLLKNLDFFYPQFASHNALTVASILEIAHDKDNSKDFEFQRLYGMGDVFYDQMVAKRPCRIYAPIGRYEELLPYLIRRILENGANNSFVNLVVNKEEPIGKILTSPVDEILKESLTKKSKKLVLPKDIFANERKNSEGLELGYKTDYDKVVGILSTKSETQKIEKKDPAKAIEIAKNFYPKWSEITVDDRAKCLNKLADLLEENQNILLQIIVNEAGRTFSDAVSEVREAIDFCRYYAVRAHKQMAKPRLLEGYTGEKSYLTYKGKGVFVCISPWNFPLAIFLGQVVAALVTGNTVIAKPAEQTPQIAALAIKLAYQAGIPEQALQLVIGDGKIGAELVQNKDIAGVAFTGSTEVARFINQSLAAKNSVIPTLIAETGGQNCMIVDSTALLEKASDDILVSAFGSAGQRCSSLRVLYVQEDVADSLIEILKGAVTELEVTNPVNLSCDVPALIDVDAAENIQSHIDKISKTAKLIAKGDAPKEGSFIAPHIFEIKNINELEREVFGPVLHIIRYKSKNIEKIIDEINSTGYGLTFGIHSRINGFIDYVVARIHAGNKYINRTTTGAVVGVHPFGGMGLSGTGPKAGGMNYLKRFTHEVVTTNNISAIGGNLELLK
jgi:RHH-type proline utilization regulon transcriptional repressor/proline dehydrogenase/delta 1-pyrroline-5-carboxylate dehydrogenase